MNDTTDRETTGREWTPDLPWSPVITPEGVAQQEADERAKGEAVAAAVGRETTLIKNNSED